MAVTVGVHLIESELFWSWLRGFGICTVVTIIATILFTVFEIVIPEFNPDIEPFFRAELLVASCSNRVCVFVNSVESIDDVHDVDILTSTSLAYLTQTEVDPLFYADVLEA